MRAERIGVAGGSNFSFLLERDEGRYVLRRPPRPPLPPSAHDMVREARLQLALAKQGVRVPPIVAVGEDESVLGVPFYVMEFVEGTVVLDELPRVLGDAEARRAVMLDLVDTLVGHPRRRRRCARPAAVPAAGQLPRAPGPALAAALGRQRDARPAVPELGERVAAAVPEPLPNAVVHGDYRIGNVIVAPDGRASPPCSTGRWARSGTRAPTSATWSRRTWSPAAADRARELAGPAPEGFPSRAELVARYEERTGRRVERLGWFEALAWWKAAVFCEAIYGRYVRGELGEAPQAARFEQGVPLMVESAFARARPRRASVAPSAASPMRCRGLGATIETR